MATIFFGASLGDCQSLDWRFLNFERRNKSKMKEGWIYVGEFPYKIDFGTKRLIRSDVEGQILDCDKARTRGDYYSLILDRNSRLPVEPSLGWAEASKTAFSILLPKEIFSRDKLSDKEFLLDMNQYSRDFGWNIHLGRAEDPKKLSPRLEHLLPTVLTKGLELWVDLDSQHIGDRNVPHNQICFRHMEELDEGYGFSFLVGENCWERTVFPAEMKMIDVRIPELVKIDPTGMAEKYGLSIEEMNGKNDHLVMVDQRALIDRLQKGKLVTVDILGQIFYIDHHLRILRPKDGMLSEGITFDQLDHCYSREHDACIFRYDPENLRISKFDGEGDRNGNFILKLPPYYDMDRAGKNLWSGTDPLAQLKWVGVRSHFVADRVSNKELELLHSSKKIDVGQSRAIQKNVQPKRWKGQAR